VRQIGRTFNAVLLDASAFGGAVAALGAIRRGTIELDQHGVVDVTTERTFNNLQISPVTIAGELDAVGKAARKIVHEAHCVLAVAPADQPRHDRLGVGIDSRPSPCVASAFRGGLGHLDVLLLRVGERPDFINLNALAGQIAKGFVLIGRANCASVRRWTMGTTETRQAILAHAPPKAGGIAWADSPVTKAGGK
jgi:hypothetical protein